MRELYADVDPDAVRHCSGVRRLLQPFLEGRRVDVQRPALRDLRQRVLKATRGALLKDPSISATGLRAVLHYETNVKQVLIPRRFTIDFIPLYLLFDSCKIAMIRTRLRLQYSALGEHAVRHVKVAIARYAASGVLPLCPLCQFRADTVVHYLRECNALEMVEARDSAEELSGCALPTVEQFCAFFDENTRLEHMVKVLTVTGIYLDALWSVRDI